VFKVRITKYKTKLTQDGKAVLEKEVSVNCPEVDKIMNSPHKLIILARSYLRLHEQSEEYLYMVCLNTKLKMTSVFELSHGNVNSSVIGIREMFQKALLANAVNIVLIHNHPSGDPTPSREDINVTKRAVEAGKLIGIDVLDHIIIGNPGYTSLKEKGHI
jgi:DNA repair protein RadC